MSDVTFANAPNVETRAETMPLPAPQPLAAPVLISDVATAVNGETLLGLLWKRLARDSDG